MKRDYKWYLLALLGGAYFFHQADRALFGVLVPYIQRELALSDVQLGHITTVLFLTIAVVTFFAGLMGDRLSRKWIITFSLIFWSLSTIGMGFAGGYVAILCLRSLATGGGESFYGPSAMSLIASYHEKTRSLAFSIHQAALYLGLMLSGVLALWVLGIVGSWRGVFIAFGVAGLVLGIAFIWLLKDSTMPSNVNPSKPTLASSFKAYFTNLNALLITTGFIAICCVNNTYIAWVPKLFHERFGVDGATSGAHAMFYHHLVAFIAIIIGGIITDRMVKRYPRFRLGLQIGSLLLGVGMIFMIGKMTSFAGAVMMTAGYGIARGLFEVNTHASVFDVVPAEHRAAVVGFMLLLAMGIGAIFSGELVGYLVSAYPQNGYFLVFGAMASAYLIAALLMLIPFYRNRYATI